MVAHYLGAARPKAASPQASDLQEQDVIPAQAVSAAEFDALLQSMGLQQPASPT